MSKADLQAALAKSAGSTRHRIDDSVKAEQNPEKEQTYSQPSRKNTKPVTGHFPKQVRDELKKLAIEQNTTLQNLMAEAFNDLFAKYGKPEIAPKES
jgi:TorA maturation chaperone TorD